MQVVDRRLNPKAKSLGNRQRFMRPRESRDPHGRARGTQEAQGVRGRRQPEYLDLVEKPAGAAIRSFGWHRTRDFVIPGNQDFSVGDTIPKPPQGGGGSGKGSADGSGDDDFVFTLTRDEFLDLFFEDLKLPNMVKAQLKSVKAHQYARAGITSDGPPASLIAAAPCATRWRVA